MRRLWKLSRNLAPLGIYEEKSSQKKMGLFYIMVRCMLLLTQHYDLTLWDHTTTLQLQVTLVAREQQNLYSTITGSLEWDITLSNV